MRQELFEQKNAPFWEELEGLLGEGAGLRKPVELLRFPWLYRRVCNHYALARSRHYSPALVAQLHDLVLRGHQQLYRRHGAWLWRFLSFVGSGFPRAVRAHAACFWLATALFLLPGLLVGGLCYSQQELIYSILDEEQVADMEYMYDPANRKPGRSAERDSETDFVMFGFYISNNIGIGFRTFAGGIFFGIGTILLLLFNGVVIGGVAGHLTRIGYQDTFWSFVSGHGALELTAIVICGAAGLVLAKALVAPGSLRRIPALRQAAPEALKLVLGAALMLLLAAFVEAFWSSSGFDSGVKYAVAAVLWTGVILYLWRLGRNSGGSL
jgi:uncharacterized membrane protein SpoIIM required for sporulation